MLAAYAIQLKTIRNAAEEDPWRLGVGWDRIPRRDYKLASTNPLFRQHVREKSVEEDEDNSYYSGILNIIAEHCCGSVPSILGNHPLPEVNDVVEDKWYEWTVNNGIGTAIRQIRRGAARTGLGIGIPYKKLTPEDPIGFGIRTVSSLRLQNPRGGGREDRIYEGIEYDKNWDMTKIYLAEEGKRDPVEYDIKDVIVWFKHTTEDMQVGMPECGPAFCLFPSVRRIIKAVVKGEEFRACMPMAVELDKDVYRPDEAVDAPTDAFEYEPGFIPTLPPGTKLNGLNFGGQSEDRRQFIYLIVGACARCVSMPLNLAMGDSSNSNMATAQIDIQPWINHVKIDRVDFESVPRKIFKMWYDRAILAKDYLPVRARSNFTYDLNYDSSFEHPDPGKRATARATDLASGATTLHRVYTDQGLNPRRQLDREARTLGITRQQLNELIMAKRTGIPELAVEVEDTSTEE